jgi:hypothetical protein
MSYLALLLTFKIAVTALFVSAPLLLAPAGFVTKRTALPPEALPWLRLYAVAVTALLVGYATGFFEIAAGRFPWGVAIMGVASNAGAVAALLATGLARRTPVLTACFAFIAFGLIAAAMAPEAALRPAF